MKSSVSWINFKRQFERNNVGSTSDKPSNVPITTSLTADVGIKNPNELICLDQVSYLGLVYIPWPRSTEEICLDRTSANFAQEFMAMIDDISFRYTPRASTFLIGFGVACSAFIVDWNTGVFMLIDSHNRTLFSYRYNGKITP
ncbi:hypothetical protein L596_029557 [Steinernema carpocapsae]|uniref:Uncharacterized protein n=1 Tax=Steinernema carpocapsae TaxID=34508 RepID=A0A4U5LUZ6_STECR|nr:hypothetical protein L596_029557 [Steinernema carpocapsae]